MQILRSAIGPLVPLAILACTASCDKPATKTTDTDNATSTTADGGMAATGAGDTTGNTDKVDDIQQMRTNYASKLKGKNVAFLPLAMGFDLTEGWAAVMKQQARELGFNLTIKDPNWSTDKQLEAMTAIIDEKPDLIIVHNNNLQVLSKSIIKAEKLGIPVIQLNMPASHQSEAYVGTDWVQLGQLTGDKMVEECGKSKGKSGKVAVIQGQITDPASVYQLQGFNAALAAHPGELTVVSTQAAEWDATKAKAVAETIAQQYKDICGVYSLWDGMSKGAGEVLKAASVGRPEPIKFYTSGGGAMVDCDGIRDGLFTHVWEYNVPDQARDITDVIKIVLQENKKPGTFHFSLFTPLQDLNKSNIGPGVCWDMKDLKARTGTTGDAPAAK
jgi:ribose transport system substrate-binding protein